MARLSDYTNAGVRKLKTDITASAGQTVFSVVYVISNNLDIFVNGIKLPKTEYTLANNTTITFDYPCRAGDLVHFVELLLNAKQGE